MSQHCELMRWVRSGPSSTHSFLILSGAIYKGIEGKEWEELYCHHGEMSQAAGAKNRVRVKKRNPWDRSDEHCDPARDRTKTRLDLWEEHLKDSESQLRQALGSTLLVASRGGCNVLQFCRREDFANDVGRGPVRKASGLAWIHGMLCICAHHSSYCNVLGKYGPHSELFFIHIKKEPVALTKAVPSNSSSLRKRSRRVR